MGYDHNKCVRVMRSSTKLQKKALLNVRDIFHSHTDSTHILVQPFSQIDTIFWSTLSTITRESYIVHNFPALQRL